MKSIHDFVCYAKNFLERFRRLSAHLEFNTPSYSRMTRLTKISNMFTLSLIDYEGKIEAFNEKRHHLFQSNRNFLTTNLFARRLLGVFSQQMMKITIKQFATA